MARIAALISLVGCALAGPKDQIGPILNDCDRYFLAVLDGCVDVPQDEATCEALDCSQAALVFEVHCQDADTCCAYRDCWGGYDGCMATCSDDSDFGRCSEVLGRCVSDELAKK